jgi:protein-S-isoprenylcysteine O-methyltransferase Ste14
MLETLLPFGLKLISLQAFVRLHSVVEHLFVSPSPPIEAIAQPEDLRLFKWVRFLLLLSCSAEHFVMNLWNPLFFVMGLLLVAVGIGLRIAAIISLGPMWSFHVVRYVGHRWVTGGIYRYLRHPAYMGNCYIPGLCLIVGSPILSVVSICFVGCFYQMRVTSEGEVLGILEKTK